MKNVCTSCKLSDKVWGVVCPTTNTLHRVTFSKGIAQFIADTYEPGKYRTASFRFIRGKRLAPGKPSSNGLYAIVSTKKDLVLRVTLFKDGAELLTGDDSRHIEEIYLVPIDKRD